MGERETDNRPSELTKIDNDDHITQRRELKLQKKYAYLRKLTKSQPSDNIKASKLNSRNNKNTKKNNKFSEKSIPQACEGA